MVVLERHAAFLAGDDLARIVLEALELRQLALVHNHVVANEPDIGAALDDAVGNPAASDVADFETLKTSRMTALPSMVSRSVGASNPDIAFFTSSTRS